MAVIGGNKHKQKSRGSGRGIKKKEEENGESGTRRDDVKTVENHGTHFGRAPRKGFTPAAKLWRRNGQASMYKNNNRKRER